MTWFYRIVHPVTMIMKTATLIILVTFLVAPMFTAKCAENELAPKKVQQRSASIGKNEIKYLACHIDCNAMGHWLPHMESMLKCWKKCEEHYKI